MNKRLRINNKEFQSLENFTNIKEGDRHKVINQDVIGGLIPSYLGYLDRYLNGTTEMHLHVGWLDRRPIGITNAPKRKWIRDYCIVFEKLCPSSQETLRLKRFSETTHGKVNSKVLPTTTYGDNLTVLICGFETAENTKSIVRRKPMFHRLIRLQRYDECPSLWMQTFDGGLNAFPQVGILDHELSVFTLGENILIQDWETRLLAALFGNTGNDDVIKCTSQVMYEITEHNGNHGVRLLGNAETIPDFILAIRQPDASVTVRIAACVPSGFLLDVYHVLLGTPKLEPPVISHDMLYYPYGEESEKEAKDAQGARDTRAHKGRIRAQSEKGSQTRQVNASKSEGVESQTSPVLHSGGYTAKNTHLGSLEDV